MKSKLYLETTVVGYLTARPSRDLVIAGHQQTTHEWWESRRKHFDIFISQLVWQEASDGDPEMVKRRLKVLRPLRWLQIRKDAVELARALVGGGAVPEQEGEDAMHIALAAAHGMHFLLTWNCAHINNAAIEERVRQICQEHDFHCPVICTPEELTMT